MTVKLSRERVCSFCGKSQSEVKKLISGPNICICDDCVMRFISLEDPQAETRSERCSFCGKAAAEVDTIFGRGEIRICSKCLEVCQEIMAEDFQTANSEK